MFWVRLLFWLTSKVAGSIPARDKYAELLAVATPCGKGEAESSFYIHTVHSLCLFQCLPIPELTLLFITSSETSPLHRWWQWNPQPGPFHAKLALWADLPGWCQRAHWCHGPAREDESNLLDQLAHGTHFFLRFAFFLLVPQQQQQPRPTPEWLQDHQPWGNSDLP